MQYFSPVYMAHGHCAQSVALHTRPAWIQRHSLHFISVTLAMLCPECRLWKPSPKVNLLGCPAFKVVLEMSEMSEMSLD